MVFSVDRLVTGGGSERKADGNICCQIAGKKIHIHTPNITQVAWRGSWAILGVRVFYSACQRGDTVGIVLRRSWPSFVRLLECLYVRIQSRLFERGRGQSCQHAFLISSLVVVRAESIGIQYSG